jgi:hypothetical protein
MLKFSAHNSQQQEVAVGSGWDAGVFFAVNGWLTEKANGEPP